MKKRVVVVMTLLCMLICLCQFIPTQAADYTNGGCVAWVKNRASQIGITLPATGKNKYGYYGASAYWDRLASTYQRGQEPKANSLAVWEFAYLEKNSGYGHVAFVESVSGDQVTVTEGGCAGATYQGNTGVIRRTTSRNGIKTLGGCSGFLGYIYLVNTGSNPQGCVDYINGGTGQISVGGWAFDTDNSNSALNIHVYIGGECGSAGVEGHGDVWANIQRVDVDNVYHTGKNHGFAKTISTNKTGQQKVYIYAINLGGGQNVCIGSKTVNIAPKINAYYSNTKVEWTDNWNAGLYGRIENPNKAKVSSVGANVWDSKGKLIVSHSEGCNLSTNYVNQTLNIVGETTLKSGLQAGTTYTFQLWANVGGKVVYSEKKTFKTTGSAVSTGTTKTQEDNVGKIDVESINENAQIISVTSVYNKTVGDKSFALDAKADYPLAYSCSDKKVATVNSKGKVTIRGTGSARITVTAIAADGSEKTTKTVTLNVGKLESTTLSSVKKSGSKKLKVSWKKYANADGYEVQYATKKDFSKSATKALKVKKAKTTTTIIKKLKTKRTYYVRVRTYKKVNGKTYYSNWSVSKSMKTK